ncbi:hypothetical protein [Mycolicibacterium pyrenivorans]|uniref:hypothetical protein n=1 Tax=Mycolicibacterium pyrenivorans TaxID=187102 RepID=UPI0021F2D3EA|nr:hypothetical protein [Mycolicibacterium pyrenivorans]MCV7149934.1 hypothetical protein [Mycolicibacterium pyrenivorans]
MRTSYMFVATVVVIAGLAAEPTAAAECTTSGNTTICSVGEGGSGPTMPYPCEYDYYCDDNYWAVDLDMDPGAGIGLPGRPGDRPGGGRPGGGGR